MTGKQKLTIVWVIAFFVVFKVLPNYVGPNKNVSTTREVTTAENSILTTDVVEAIQNGGLGMTGVIESLASAEIDSEGETMLKAVRLFELVEHGSADYLEADHKAQDLLSNYDNVIQYQILIMNMSVIDKIVMGDDGSQQLDVSIQLPLTNDDSCDFSERNIVGFEANNRIQFNGRCEAYGGFQGEYDFNTKHYDFEITPTGKSTQFYIMKLSAKHAVLGEANSALTP